MFERELRDLAFVPRWVIMRTIAQQNVAEHSFFVAAYAEQIARILEWKGDIGLLLRYALYHDLEECFIGDIPGPVKAQVVHTENYNLMSYRGLNKRFFHMLGELLNDPPVDVKAIIKLADELEGVLFLCGEIQMGNQSVYDVYFERLRVLEEKVMTYLPKYFGHTEEQAKGVWGNIFMDAVNKNQNMRSQVVRGEEIANAMAIK